MRTVPRARWFSGWGEDPSPLDLSIYEVADMVAERLAGQSDGLVSDVLDKIGRPDLEDYDEFLRALDGELFICEICEWWCGADEEADVEIAEAMGATGRVCHECCDHQREWSA